MMTNKLNERDFTFFLPLGLDKSSTLFLLNKIFNNQINMNKIDMIVITLIIIRVNELSFNIRDASVNVNICKHKPVGEFFSITTI